MKRETTLLARFEQLGELQTKAETQTGVKRSWINRSIRAILDLEPTYKKITACMQDQRAATEWFSEVVDLRQQTEFTRRAYLSNQVTTVERNMQLSFSLPVDFHETVPDFDEEKLLKLPFFVVIQPELISDDFMYALGLMPRWLNRVERVEKKIEAIPVIKGIFATAIPVHMRKWKSGRIIRIDRPGMPYDGKYIVFQEITEKWTDTADKTQPSARMSPRVYDNVYSLIRGQYHAIDGVMGRKRALQETREQHIPLLQGKWKDSGYPDEKRKADIANLMKWLQGKISFNEQRALEDRLARITFNHNEQDIQRLIWAFNDVSQEIAEKIGKKWELTKQLDVIEDATLLAESVFYNIFDSVMNHIQTMDQGELKKKVGEAIKQWQEIAPLSQALRNDLGRIYALTRVSLGRVKTSGFIGQPFNTMYHALENHIDTLPKRINLEYIRKTLSFLLALKHFAHGLTMIRLEHYEKMYGNHRYPDEFIEQLLHIQEGLNDTYFLPNIRLWERAKKEFEKMCADINAAVEKIRETTK